jgi:hypothetical protein
MAIAATIFKSSRTSGPTMTRAPGALRRFERRQHAVVAVRELADAQARARRLRRREEAVRTASAARP